MLLQARLFVSSLSIRLIEPSLILMSLAQLRLGTYKAKQHWQEDECIEEGKYHNQAKDLKPNRKVMVSP